MRTISSTILTEIAKSNAIPRTLYHMELINNATGATEHLYLTNHEVNLVFGGITYQNYKVKHSAIKTYISNQVDNCTITIDNVDRGMSAYFAYAEFAGQNVEVWKIFLDASLNPIGTPANHDYIVQFKGFMDRPKVNENTVEVRAVNIFNREQSFTPWRRFTAKCNWRFCKSECGYNGGNGQPRGTATSGTATTLTDTALGSYTTDYWKGGSLKILSGTNKGETRRVSAYNATTKTFTVEGSFSAAIDATSKYIVECDKSITTCRTIGGAFYNHLANIGGNIANYGGYERKAVYLYSQKKDGAGWDLDYNQPLMEGFVPLAYGTVSIKAQLIDGLYSIGTIGNRTTSIWGICAGEIDSILECLINGHKINRTAEAYVERLGTSPQILSRYPYSNWLFDAWQFYFPQTAIASINSGEGSAITAYYPNYGINPDLKNNNVVFIVKGLKVQRYNSDGTLNGVPVWSDNPAWCILDYLVNRASKPIKELPGALTDYIDFSTFYTAAALCDTKGYKLNLVINEQKKDTEWLDLMLVACRGYFTYSAGKMELNLETVSSPVFTFDDTTNDNICEGSFEYSKNDVNDVPNRIIVKYTDQEIRENMALVNGYLPAANSTIPYSDIQGTFASSGTVYIGGEAITYTGNAGGQLTGCSARSKDYPSGYPLFQGAQTFPEMTAIYNDYDAQDKARRVIEKEIDGKAIPTYRQAYNIAEYHGKKAIEGNMNCGFRGQMDSLKLTVGDVVNVPHSLPAWTNATFRIAEASESEDEEVDYTLALYDAGFYVENDPTPGVNLATGLPNPWAVPGQVTNLSLSEDAYINTDGIYVPTLTLTYTLPSGNTAIFWDKAKVQISINGGNYSDYGIDISRGAGFKVDSATGGFKVGDTVSVKVISISSNNIMADASTAPTASKKINGLVIVPSSPRGLCLEGNPDPNNTTWDGLRFALTWWKSSQTGGAGNEGGLGAGGFVDPYWNGDEYELWVGGACIDSGMTKEARYDYVYGDGYMDFLDAKIAAAHGAVTFKVRRVSLNLASEWSMITITQVVPATPAGLSSDFNGRNLVLKWNKAVETDFDYYELVLNSRTIKLTDPQYTYSFEENVKDNTTADPSITYSLKTYDIYGNASSALTGTFTNPVPAIPIGLNTVAWIKGVEFAWAKNSETDIRGYSIRTKVATGAWSSWVEQTENNYIRILTDSEVTAYGAGATVYVEVKAIDVYAQGSTVASASAASLFVDVSMVADGSITAPKIAGGAVGTTQLADAAITTAKIANTAVDNTKLAALAVDAAKLADSAVTTTKIANAAVGSAAIANLAVGTGHIADAAITNAKIEKWILGKSGISFPPSPVDGESFYRTDLNITYRYAVSTTSWIAVDYVADAGRIVDGVITSVKIADAAISSAKIADLAVSNAKIADGTIQTAKIGDAQITGAKIATATITTANIGDAQITGAKIASATIGTANIADAQITGAKIANATIQTANIADAQITGAKIASATIGTANIGDAQITGAKIANATIQTANIADAQITGAKIATATITDANIGSLNADKITAGTITGRTLQTAATGERFVVSSVDNYAHFYDSSAAEIIRMGSASSAGWATTAYAHFGDTYTGSGGGIIGLRAIAGNKVGARAISAKGFDGGWGGEFFAHSQTPGVYAGVAIAARCQGRISYPSGSFAYAATPLYIEPGPNAGAPTHQSYTGSLWMDSNGVLYSNTSSGGIGTTWTKVAAQ